MTHTLPPRGQWPHLLRAAPRADLLEARAAALEALQPRHLALPQNGLALLPLKDGAFHETFNLGEIPLARVHLALTDSTGREARGAAWVMEDDMATVEALAIADALLAAHRTEAPWPQAEAFARLLALGERAIERLDAERKVILAATTVDFSLLGETDDDA
ncbi:MAG TPA: phosphonate C-P lyase system protein PhnG [Chromatiales bacterium]|nr:phosphonate C-P lyase system protein PhnG [Chromatiales bacterium]